MIRHIYNSHMASANKLPLNPRKSPVQERSKVTVEVIFQATLQLLLETDIAGLTTTRVAERAGVSVGTIYQYFPNKQALLLSLVRRHLEQIAQTMEDASKRLAGQSIGSVAEGLTAAFLDAKIRDIKASRALYTVFSELKGNDVLDSIGDRIHLSIVACLETVTDGQFEDPAVKAFALQATLTGVTRTVLERGASPISLVHLRSELTAINRAYLTAAAKQFGLAERP